MDPDLIMAVGLIVFMLLLLAMGLEIALVLGIVAAVGLLFFVDQSLSILARSAWDSLDSFVLTAVPLFVLMGSLIGNSGVAEYLFYAIEKWTGRLPGSLANAVIVGDAVFGAMCGSSLAATATFGKLVVPTMEQRHYDPALMLGAIATGAILVPLIPPSTLMIIYGAWQGVSIVALFAGGIIPGLILAVLFSIVIMIRVKLNPKLVPPAPQVTWRERLVALGHMMPFALVILGVLGVIFGGVMTPTEAAALGASLSLVLTLAYRRLTWSVLKASLSDAVMVTSFALFIMVMATVVAHVYNSAGIIVGVKDFVMSLGLGRHGILALFLVMYLIMGCFFDGWSMLFLTFPFVMPIIVESGINPIWWGVVYVMAGDQSNVTPPFGMGLFVLHSVAPQYPMSTIVRGALPLLAVIYVNIALLAAFPQLVLWLPSLLGR